MILAKASIFDKVKLDPYLPYTFIDGLLFLHYPNVNAKTPMLSLTIQVCVIVIYLGCLIELCNFIKILYSNLANTKRWVIISFK